MTLKDRPDTVIEETITIPREWAETIRYLVEMALEDVTPRADGDAEMLARGEDLLRVLRMRMKDAPLSVLPRVRRHGEPE